PGGTRPRLGLHRSGDETAPARSTSDDRLPRPGCQRSDQLLRGDGAFPRLHAGEDRTENGPHAPDPRAPRPRRLPRSRGQALRRPRPRNDVRRRESAEGTRRGADRPPGAARVSPAVPAPEDGRLDRGRGTAAGGYAKGAGGVEERETVQ